jgi:hypothetical protein
VVFAVSNCESGRKAKKSGNNHATLYALDALTGEEMYSTADQVKVPAALTEYQLLMAVSTSRPRITRFGPLGSTWKQDASSRWLRSLPAPITLSPQPLEQRCVFGIGGEIHVFIRVRTVVV